MGGSEMMAEDDAKEEWYGMVVEAMVEGLAEQSYGRIKQVKIIEIVK